MVEKVDLRGLTCPQPVIRTKKLFDNPEITSVEALVDDDVCVANLERLGRTIKALVSSTREEAGHYSVSIVKANSVAQTTGSVTDQPAKPKVASQLPTSVVFITKDQLGQGDEEFGRTLLNVFLQTLLESGHLPQAILMANTGVKLMAPGSAVVKVLDDFKKAGTEVLACGLCVKFYGIEDHIAKEQITSMFAICEYLLAVDKVITP